YRDTLSARRDPIAGTLQYVVDKVRQLPRRVVFAEGEESQGIRAAYSFAAGGLGHPVLVGRDDAIRETVASLGLEPRDDIEIANARLSERNAVYAEVLYARLQRQGYLQRDC